MASLQIPPSTSALQNLPPSILWQVLAELELHDLYTYGQTCKAAHEILKTSDFWYFLYYRHLMPSPLYIDVQHGSLLNPPQASWRYLYLEQIWVQYLTLLYSQNSPCRYFHRTIATDSDATYQIAQFDVRGAVGPFGLDLPQVTHCINTAFKQPKQVPRLEPGEVTGCFNWSPPGAPKEETDYEAITLSSLLPCPPASSHSKDPEVESQEIEELRLWASSSGHYATPPIWFLNPRNYIASLAASMTDFGHFGDYWQECSQKAARNCLQRMISQFPPKSIVEYILDENLRDLHISTDEPSIDDVNYASQPLEPLVANKIADAVINLARLGPPSLKPVIAPAPTRYFVVSNHFATNFETGHHHAIAMLSPYRIMVFVFRWLVPDSALGDEGSASGSGSTLAGELASFYATPFIHQTSSSTQTQQEQSDKI